MSSLILSVWHVPVLRRGSVAREGVVLCRGFAAADTAAALLLQERWPAAANSFHSRTQKHLADPSQLQRETKRSSNCKTDSQRQKWKNSSVLSKLQTVR